MKLPTRADREAHLFDGSFEIVTGVDDWYSANHCRGWTTTEITGTSAHTAIAGSAGSGTIGRLAVDVPAWKQAQERVVVRF